MFKCFFLDIFKGMLNLDPGTGVQTGSGFKSRIRKPHVHVKVMIFLLVSSMIHFSRAMANKISHISLSLSHDTRQ